MSASDDIKLKNKRTYGKVSYLMGKWVVEECEPHVSIKLKDIFKKLSIVGRPPFYFNDTLDFCEDLNWFMQRYPLEISKKDFKYLSSQKRLFERNIAEMETLLLPKTKVYLNNVSLLKPNQSPRDYQIKTVKILEKVKGLICGDDLGLGKTYTGMTVCINPKNLPAIIVVETQLPKQWNDKFKEFTTLKVHIIKSKTAYSLPKADVYIYKYSSIAGWIDIFTTGFFKTVIYDEVQNLRTGTASDKGIAAKVLSEHANLNMGMSHTPIFGYALEVWNIYDILAPGALGSKDEFIREWSDGVYNNENKIVIKDPKALGTYLRENYLFIKNTEGSTNRKTPPVETYVHEISHDETLVDNYLELANTLANTVLTSKNFKEVGRASLELDSTTRQMTGIAKAKAVANFVKMLLEDGEPVLLAGWHREVYKIWLEELKEYNPLMFTGSESSSKKEKNKVAFVNGESNLLIISLRSGAGIDGLQARGSTIVHGELDWANGVHIQLRGRLKRDGQKKHTKEYFLISNFGADPVMRETLGLKASQQRGIFELQGATPKNYADKNRIKRLAENLLIKNKKRI